MKNLIYVLFAISIISSCKPVTTITDNDKSTGDVILDTTIDKAIITNVNKDIADVKPSDLQTMVTFLASDNLQGRNTGSDGIAVAANYIENQLRAFNIKPYYKTYRDSFMLKDQHAYNLIGIIPGNDPKLKNEFIILGAHYDHIGFAKALANDSIANGANDNATGTAAVLAMAKYFSQARTNGRSLLIVLFSGEEHGLKGSEHLAEKLKSENFSLYTMVNMEMIGVPFKDRDYQAFVTGYDYSNFAEKINEYVGNKLLGFSEISKKYGLFKASDNYPFYLVFKVPCQTIASCDLSNYDFYHHVDDESDKQDYEHMAVLVNRLIPAIEKMTNTETKEITLYAH